MKKKKFTYTDSGVDRNLRKKSKEPLKDILGPTYGFSRYGKIIQLPFGNILPIGKERWLDIVIEGIGTKVLVAQLAKRYDTIGIDGVAMAVNDVIRSGAKILAIADNIHAVKSDPALVKEWIKGIAVGAIEAECPVSSGEIGDVAEIIKGIREHEGFDIIVAAVGELRSKKEIIFGNNIKPGDAIIGLKSSGLHSNGISLARKVLFKQWGGKFQPFDIPDGFDREIIFEALEPTKIYVKPVLAVAKAYKIKAAVHITGDAYLKFRELMKFSRGIGFCFESFYPQPIFDLIQKVAPEVKGTVADAEMFKTFNMGWGFALICNREDVDGIIDVIDRYQIKAEEIGKITDSGEVVVKYKNKDIILI